MKIKLLAIFEVALLLAPFALLAFYWPEIPARVPIHWNLGGQINDWSSRPFGMLLLPCWALIISFLLRILPLTDRKLRRNNPPGSRMDRVLPILRVGISAFFFVIFLALLGAALGHVEWMNRILPSSVLLLLALLGNYMSVMRPNYFIGFRTPWTLRNPETWRATHRLGGRLLFFGAIALLLAQFFLSPPVFIRIFISLLLLLVVWSLFYSWHHARSCDATV